MKRVLLVLACFIILGLFVAPSFAQGNSIAFISVRNTSCNGGGGWVAVHYNIDGGSPRYITVMAHSTVVNNVSNQAPGGHVGEYYVAGMDLSAPDYAIKVTVRLGNGPSSSAYDMITAYFDCRNGAELTPRVDARNNTFTLPRNIATTLNVVGNDVSTLPLRIPKILTQPVHAEVVNGADRSLIVTADSDYIGVDSFTYEICDISGLCDIAAVRLNIVNMPPTCDAAADNSTWYWAPNHDMVYVQVNGVVDPDGDAFVLVITAITVIDTGGGDGATANDYDLERGMIRVERSGSGDGRTYELTFDATDIWGESCSGVASVYVPHDRNDFEGDPAESVDPNATTTPTPTTTTTTGTHGNGNGNGGGGNGGGGGGHGTDGTGTGNGNGNANGNSNGNSNGNANGNSNGNSNGHSGN